MKKPENVLETKDYIEPNNFESDQEAILFYSYVEQENYIKYLEQQLLIDVVVGSTIWQPTMILRWYETNNYNPVNDDFDKILQQKWQGDKGDEKWEDIEVHER